jgi:tRNA modification GTPase
VLSTTDTIVAIATPPGRGGIGVVRLSGPEAHATALRLFARTRALEARHATLETIRVAAGATEDLRLRPDAAGGVREARARADDGVRTAPIDQVVVTHFPAPASYTGEDVVEISAHGSPVVLRGIVEAAIDRGARLAEPGEFTLRAYLNGRMDLAQAEAVADLIDAVTPLQARTAFDQLQGTLTRATSAIDRTLFDLIARLEASVDFPEEGYHFVDPGAVAAEIDAILDSVDVLLAGARRGRLVREGFQIAIVGRPNVGKSSLFNALAGAGRAIVAETAGTTRDLVTETIDLEGLRVTLVDTAGLRETGDVVELEGVARSRGAAGVADLTLVVIDRSQPFDSSDLPGLPFSRNWLLVANKADLPLVHVGGGPCSDPVRADPVSVSALTGQGLDELRRRILQALDIELVADRPEITNVRHIALVERAREALLRARRAALADGQSLPEEFVLADLQGARAALEEIAGRRAPEDLLAHIFSRFCVGK